MLALLTGCAQACDTSGGAYGASGPATGTGGPGESVPPRTLAEAEARFAQTVDKCRQLSVAAVREECLREAARTLERDRSRLREGGRPDDAGR